MVVACGAEPVRAPAVLPLPDLVELAADAPLPPGVEQRSLPCAVIAESADEVAVDLSTTRGISQVVRIPRAQVRAVKRGDPLARRMASEPEFFQMPRVSLAEAEYGERLRQLEALIQAHPESPSRGRLEELAGELKREAAEVAGGRIRLGASWFALGELGAEDLAAWTGLQELSRLSPEAFIRGAASWAERVQGWKPSRLYPELVRMFQEKGRGAVAAVSAASPAAGELMRADPAVRDAALADAVKAAARLPQDADPESIGLLKRARAVWPELALARRVQDATLEVLRNRVREAAAAGDEPAMSVAFQAHRNYGGAELLPPEELAWREQALAALSLLQAWKAAETAWKENRAEQALQLIGMVKSFQAGAGPDAAPWVQKALALEAEILRRQKEAEILQIRGMLDAGRLGEVARALKSLRAGLAQSAPGSPERRQASDLAVDGALAAARGLNPVSALGLVLEAWRLDGGNARAQIALSVAVVIVVLAGAVVLFIVFYAYAVASNRLDLVFFRKRLRLARLEDARFEMRQRQRAERDEKSG